MANQSWNKLIDNQISLRQDVRQITVMLFKGKAMSGKTAEEQCFLLRQH